MSTTFIRQIFLLGQAVTVGALKTEPHLVFRDTSMLDRLADNNDLRIKSDEVSEEHFENQPSTDKIPSQDFTTGADQTDELLRNSEPKVSYVQEVKNESLAKTARAELASLHAPNIALKEGMYVKAIVYNKEQTGYTITDGVLAKPQQEIIDGVAHPPRVVPETERQIRFFAHITEFNGSFKDIKLQDIRPTWTPGMTVRLTNLEDKKFDNNIATLIRSADGDPNVWLVDTYEPRTKGIRLRNPKKIRLAVDEANFSYAGDDVKPDHFAGIDSMNMNEIAKHKVYPKNYLGVEYGSTTLKKDTAYITFNIYGDDNGQDISDEITLDLYHISLIWWQMRDFAGVHMHGDFNNRALLAKLQKDYGFPCGIRAGFDGDTPCGLDRAPGVHAYTEYGITRTENTQNTEVRENILQYAWTEVLPIIQWLLGPMRERAGIPVSMVRNALEANTRKYFGNSLHHRSDAWKKALIHIISKIH